MVSYYPSPNYILDVFFDCFYIQVELITDKITLNQVNVHGKQTNHYLISISNDSSLRIKHIIFPQNLL